MSALQLLHPPLCTLALPVLRNELFIISLDIGVWMIFLCKILYLLSNDLICLVFCIIPEHQFEVEVIKAPPLSRLFQVHYTLYIQCTNLCLISGVPPKIQASWLLCDIKKFGIIENKFCFEAGKRCEKCTCF